jgi:hypothetical protein
MINKKDLDKLLTLTRKWLKEKDQDKSAEYCNQARSLSRAIAKGTSLEYEDMVTGNRIFESAWYVAVKRWPNEQLYIMIERAGEQVDDWEYQGHFI